MEANLLKVLAPPVDIDLPAERDADDKLVTKTFRLAYDFNAVIAIKTATGKSILNAKTWEKIEDDPEMISAMLWGGLQLFHPELTIEVVRSMMFGGSWSSSLNKIMEAWTAARPRPAQESPAKAAPAAPTT